MKKWIVFDVDDVICNFRESLYQSFKKLGKDVHWTHWTEYAHVEIYGLENSQALHKHMREHFVIEQALCEPGVKEMLTMLKTKGYYIGFLTARAWHEKAQSITSEFVSSNELPVDKIIISGFHKDKKSSHMNQFEGEIVAFFDDSIHHVKDFSEHNIAAYLVDRPWNKHETTLPRVSNLRVFIENLPHANDVLKLKK